GRAPEPVAPPAPGVAESVTHDPGVRTGKPVVHVAPEDERALHLGERAHQQRRLTGPFAASEAEVGRAGGEGEAGRGLQANEKASAWLRTAHREVAILRSDDRRAREQRIPV